MKTVSKHKAVECFEALGELVHSGETVVVVNGGKPWLKMVPVSKPRGVKTAADFKSRLDRISRKPIPGVSEELKRVRQ